MKNGWVKLWRKSIDSQTFKNDHLWKLWTWCLMRAAREECWVNVKTGRGETQVKLEPGQFIFGRHSAATQLGWKPATTQKRLKLLVDRGNCITQSITHGSIVTICNWERYQQSQKAEVSGKVSPKYHPSITDKNNKKSISKDMSAKKDADPEVKTFILEWTEIWSQKFGKPYTPNWGKEGKLVKEMLKIHSFQELRELRQEFFRSDDSFVRNSDYSIGIFKTQLNKLITIRKGGEPMRDYMGQPLE